MLWAKRKEEVFQTLEGHLKDSLLSLKSLVSSRGFKAFCDRWNIQEREALLSACLCVFLHDAGKGSKAFQEAIKEGKHRPDLPHSLFSLAVAQKVWEEGHFPSVWRMESEPVLELLAIVAHHSQLWSDLYKHGIKRDARLKFEPQLSALLIEVGHFAAELFGFDELRKLPCIDLQWFKDIRLSELVDNGLEFLKEVTDEITDKPRLKAVYTWLLSLVKGSDLLAGRAFDQKAANSTEKMLGQTLDRPPEIWILPADLEKKVLQGKTPYPFQRRILENAQPFMVLRAPCGRGKTEAALLWFSKLLKERKAERLIFAMPTQVTSNAMRERLEKDFGKGNVGLYHGRSYLEHRELAALKLTEEKPEEDLSPENEAELAREENFLGEVMVKPATVTTVDHVLYSFVHGFRQADFALGCLQTAAIVFDEVHYYDRKMLSELQELFEILRQMHIPHLLMSGTLPDFLIREARLEEYAPVEDEEGSTFTPFIIEKRENPLIVRGTWEMDEGFVEEILRGHEKGLVQFVVLNTVRKAQEVYKALQAKGIPREESELLHSRFCYLHRREKERKVIKGLKERKGPLLLVSTQVIEVSLDISCDRMFTELAPMDALGQRAGRLNRGAQRPDGHKLAVFRPSTAEGEPDFLPYREVSKVVETTWETLREIPTSYTDVKGWCDVVYANYTLLKEGAQLRDLFERCILFGPNYDEIRFSEEEGKAFKPREIHVPAVDVIPHSVLVERPEVGEVAGEAGLYLAPVPVWWVAKSNREGLGLFYRKEIGKRAFLVCRLPYSSEVGFEEDRIGVPPEGVIVD